MNWQSFYWLVLIKLCRFLCAIKLEPAAEWVGKHTGLTARLKDFIENSHGV